MDLRWLEKINQHSKLFLEDGDLGVNDGG